MLQQKFVNQNFQRKKMTRVLRLKGQVTSNLERGLGRQALQEGVLGTIYKHHPLGQPGHLFKRLPGVRKEDEQGTFLCYRKPPLRGEYVLVLGLPYLEPGQIKCSHM